MKGGKVKSGAGFTLLEVLIALTILSAVSLVVIRAVGDGMTQIGDSGWKDQAMRLGRTQLLRLNRQDLRGNMEGSFAPDYPHITWKATVKTLNDLPGRKLELVIREGSHELLLEQIIIP